jgi:transcriptional regulator with XRE-family HTH domain
MKHTIGRRIQAAQALGGFNSLNALAAAINRPGLSVGTLRRISAGHREAKDYELAWIAEACGVTPAFFTADLTQGTEAAESDRTEYLARRLLERLDKIDGRLKDLEEVRREAAADLLEREIAGDDQPAPPQAESTAPNAGGHSRGRSQP